MHAIENGEHAFECHLAEDLFFADSNSEFAGCRQEEKIGGADAINRGHKSDGNSPADFIDFVEVLHHLDEAEHSSDNANGRREATSRLKELRNFLFPFFFVVEFEFHNLAELLRFCAVDCQHERAAEKGILDFAGFAVERDQTFAAGLIGILDERGDRRLCVLGGLDEYMRQPPEAGEDDGQRVLDEDCTHCPSEHDHGGGRLQHLAQIAAFQQQAEQDAAEGKQQTGEGRLIHEGSYFLFCYLLFRHHLVRVSGHDRSGGAIVPPHDSLKNGAAELNDAFQHFLRAFADHDLLAGYKRDDSVRRLLHEFHQVRIHSDRVIIKAGQLDHAWLLLSAAGNEDSGSQQGFFMSDRLAGQSTTKESGQARLPAHMTVRYLRK